MEAELDWENLEYPCQFSSCLYFYIVMKSLKERKVKNSTTFLKI